MKNYIISFLQKITGFERYLFFFSLFIIFKLRWDKNEKDFLQIFNLISDNGIVLDIGANIGVMTTHFSRKLKNSSVFAFEPIPYNIRTLKKVISFFKLKNVTVLEHALGNENGTIKMIVPEIHSAKKHGLSHVVTRDETIETGDEFEVEVKRLDDIPALNSGKIAAMKIDVEGYEYHVLQGATRILKNDKPVIYCELWKGEQRDKTFALLRSFGYSVKVVENNRLVHFQDQKKQNFFFIPA